MQTDTPESLRALATAVGGISPAASTPEPRFTQICNTLDKTEDALRRAADRLAAVEALGMPPDLPEPVRDMVCAWLADPAFIRVNMLRGGIAKPADLVWMNDTNGPVAAALAVARREGAEEMRERAAVLPRISASRTRDLAGQMKSPTFFGFASELDRLAASIRALTLPGDPA